MKTFILQQFRLKKITVLLFIFPVLFSCGSHNNIEYNIGNYSGDTLSKAVTLDNGNKRVYYYDHRVYQNYIEEVITFKGDDLHGISKTFHSNGKIKSVVEFNNNRIWNVITYQDSSGNKVDYGHLKNGNGRIKMYNKDSQTLVKEGDVVDGYKEGYWYSYCGDGIEICDSTLYIKGKDEFMKDWEVSGGQFFQIYK